MSEAKGVQTIRGKVPVLKTAVCAVEYDSGELYYDRMGRVVRQLSKDGRGWLREAAFTGKQTQVLNAAENLILTVTPSGTTMTLGTENHPEGLESEDIARLAAQSAFALGVVVDELEIPHFQRIDYRERYSFACSSVEETENWVKELGLLRVDEALYANFGRHYAMRWTISFVGVECRYHLELTGTERSAKVPVGPSEIRFKHSRAAHLDRHELLRLMTARRDQQLDPEYAAILDISAFLWDDTMPILTFPGSSHGTRPGT